MDIILKGILTGLLLSVLVGATFFMLIETSMTRGFRAALWFDLGVLLCDITILSSVYFFTSWITRTLVHNEYVNITGGLIFMGFGINYILSGKRNDSPGQVKKRNWKLLLNGFFINLLNPSVLLFWLSTMAIVITQLKLTGRETLVYFSFALGVMVAVDVLKAYFAYRISSLLSPRVLKGINIFAGLLMTGLGVYILFE
jgi:threonine/homoserine/homoserine lactone efflux protein